MDDTKPQDDQVSKIATADAPTETPTDIPTDNGETVNELFTIESSIKTHISMLDKLKEELKKHNEMMKSFLENDETYMKTSKTAKEANNLKSKAKRSLLDQPAGKELSGKIKTLQEQNKDLQEGISYYLREYQRITGSNVFEGDDGEIREIVYVARLVRRTSLEK